MAQKNPQTIEMTLDGSFVDRPSGRQPSLLAMFVRLAVFGVFLAVAATLFWTAILLLPFLLLAALAGLILVKYRYRL
jgi:hypothetical protein